MKAKDIAKKITFERTDVGNGLIMITARLECLCHEDTTAEALKNPSTLEYVHEQLKEKILRLLYEDQAQELRAAFMELYLVDSWDIGAQHEARGKILEAARRQRPGNRKRKGKANLAHDA